MLKKPIKGIVDPTGTITREYVEDYIREILPKEQGILRILMQQAQERHIPVIEPEVAALLKNIIKMSGSKKILEIGTAIGFSAILFATAAGKDASIVTIERDPDYTKEALKNIQEANLEKMIKVIPGDALEVLPRLKNTFDMVFLDGAKGHYGEMLEQSITLLKPGGLLISDNILFRGMVANDELVRRRKKTIVMRMREYLKTITTHPQLETSILPVGDGLAISLKNQEEEI
ncbi:Predicted O-methyltransferase YrrM [Tindallia magadiensis]|uniref:tRNA 5-hydroxyuridine methyltransferase n=1 Tax=Tindallia magadiensis TaxID=69895 RepID=A0A1I3ABQ7_9FIRM|nr:O-methyltransferase [Tindallia magadiensis]SFH47524.1 Predicted O-methyltransferase YrrM [Tindallia magadiensis]